MSTDSVLPEDLAAESASAAFLALEQMPKRESRSMSEDEQRVFEAQDRWAIDTETHIAYSWRIIVARPSDWQEPADPNSFDPEGLARFNDEDYRTIALHSLGGLADHGSSRPIVPMPRKTIDTSKSTKERFNEYATWALRFPVPEDIDPSFQNLCNADELADLFDQFMLAANTFCTMVAGIGTKYLPQNRFPGGMESLLRNAAAEHRPTRRVYRFKFCGVWHYDVGQAHRMWPKHFED